jgi:16S rRNA (cytosine967-C5)-methyltransferase
MMKWRPREPVNAILLDAPCSATGIYRRHPDVLHRVQPRAIRELAGVQQAMLARAADWLKPGGRLVYSVCSLEPEEGEEVVQAFADSRADFTQDEVKRILPGDWMEAGGADSFFMARFQRG